MENLSPLITKSINNLKKKEKSTAIIGFPKKILLQTVQWISFRVVVRMTRLRLTSQGRIKLLEANWKYVKQHTAFLNWKPHEKHGKANQASCEAE